MAKSASRMKKFNLSSMFNLIIFRYLRLLIFCIILILFQTTLIKFLGDGPVWRKVKIILIDAKKIIFFSQFYSLLKLKAVDVEKIFG